MTALQAQVEDRLPKRLKVFYGSGQAINAIVDAAVNTFLLFYLTAVCGMDGSAAGGIFLVSLAIDGLLDPIIGRLSDRWRSRWGRRLPFMVVSIPPMMFAFLLLFSLPRGLGGVAMFCYVLALNLILRVGLSVFALPHSALNAELTHDYRERSVLSTYRAFFLVVGFALVLLPAFGLIFTGANGLQARDRYPALGATLAMLLAVFGAMSVLGVAREVLRLPTPTVSVHAARSNVVSEIGQLFGNPSFVTLFVGAVLVLVGQGVATALNLHVFRYYWVLPAALIQVPLLVLPLGMLVGTAAAGLLLKRYEKRDCLTVAVIVTATYPALIAMLSLVGILAPGSVAATVALVLNGIIFGACGAVCFVCFYSMIADAVDEHDLKFGVRREALFAAALMIGSKAATGLGAFLAGLGLQWVGFHAPADGVGAVAVSAATARGMGLLWGPGAAVVILSAVPFIRRYGVDRQHHIRVVTALDARNAAALVQAQPHQVE